MADPNVALIAGAGRGIGRAVAIALSDNGHAVALTARTRTELEETARLCGNARTLVKTSDVSNWGDVDSLVRTVELEHGPIDVLVNAAGTYGPIGITTEIDPAAWSKAITVNLLGTFHLCRAVAPLMAQRRRGRVVLFAGGGATAPLPRFSAYAASKAAIVRFAETLAVELSETGVTVNSVAPGLVDTRLQDDVIAAGARAGALLERIRAAREFGTDAVPPEVAASLVAFLASNASGHLTGKLISAPHDPWHEWGARSHELNASPLYTLRRIDAFTVQPVIRDIGSDDIAT